MRDWGKIYVITITIVYAVSMLGYEFAALFNREEGDTISEFVWETVAGKPWLSALMCITLLGAFGLLMGHFFWRGR